MGYQGSGLESCYPDLPEIGIEALSVNSVRRSGRFAELLQGRNTPEHRHAVHPQDLAVRRLRQLDPLALRVEASGLDPTCRDGPEDVGLAGAASSVWRLPLLLDCSRGRLPRGGAPLFFFGERALREGHENNPAP